LLQLFLKELAVRNLFCSSQLANHRTVFFYWRKKQRSSHFIHSDFLIQSPFQNKFTIESCIRDVNNGCIIIDTFESLKNDTERFNLTNSGRRILETPNAGGNSIWSEVFSLEVLSAIYGAKLLHTEMELEYKYNGCKITDYSVQLMNEIIGVSVTRAMKFNGQFTEEDALILLKKKLEGINVSSKCIVHHHKWKKQILHIWAQHDYIAHIVSATYHKIDPSLKKDTIIIITVSRNADWLY